jgi:hypothetical protein
MPLIQQLTNLLVQMANAAVQAAQAVNSVLNLFGLGGSSGSTSVTYTSTNLGGGTSSPGFTAGYSAGSSYGGAWAQGVTAGMIATTGQKPAPANLAAILAAGLLQHLAGTAAQVSAAVSQMVSAVGTDESAGIISRSRGSALQVWLEQDGQKLEALATQRAKILATIVAATKYAGQVTTRIEGEDSLTNAAAGGWNGGPQATSQIISHLRMDVANISKFATNIARLRKLGLNRAYLDQLIQMGPNAGGQLAEQLANSGIGDIKQINSAESQIVKASVGLGDTAANAMYDSGKMAGRGFLSGLEAQQAAIEKMMEKIAQSMVNTLKRELGIHSPSTVARSLARDGWGQGLILGLEDSHSNVMTASARLARAFVPGHGVAVAGAGGGVPRIQLEFTGNANDPLWQLFKKNIRVKGGNVEVVGR